MSKLARGILILIIVLILGMLVYLVSVRNVNNRPNPQDFLVTKVPFNQLPRYFPASVFMEPDAKIVENYNTKFPDGRVWATRVYETAVDLTTLKKDYESYLNGLNGWIMSKPYQRGGNDVFLTVARGQDSLVVHLSQQSSGPNLITISYQTRK